MRVPIPSERLEAPAVQPAVQPSLDILEAAAGRPVELASTQARYRAVMLDALGTLVELEPPWPLLRRILHRRHGIEVSDADARQAMLAEMAFYRAHHHEGRDEASLRELRGRCASILRDHLPVTVGLSASELTDALLDSLRFTPYGDAAPALAKLRAAGLRLAVVSNWDCSLRSVLGELGLAGAMDAIVVSAQVGARKPDPRIFRVALQQLGCEPGNALFVGDSLETDVVGARAAGLRAVLLDRAGRGPADEEVVSVHSLTELVALAAPTPKP